MLCPLFWPCCGMAVTDILPMHRTLHIVKKYFRDRIEIKYPADPPPRRHRGMIYVDDPDSEPETPTANQHTTEEVVHAILVQLQQATSSLEDDPQSAGHFCDTYDLENVKSFLDSNLKLGNVNNHSMGPYPQTTHTPAPPTPASTPTKPTKFKHAPEGTVCLCNDISCTRSFTNSKFAFARSGQRTSGPVRTISSAVRRRTQEKVAVMMWRQKAKAKGYILVDSEDEGAQKSLWKAFSN